MSEPGYLSGFGNEFATEAVAGALPKGQNSPQKPPLGLYAEQLSGSPFTAPRGEIRRSWLYRIRPSAMHGPYRRIDNQLLRSGPFTEAEAPPNRLRRLGGSRRSRCSRYWSVSPIHNLRITAPSGRTSSISKVS